MTSMLMAGATTSASTPPVENFKYTVDKFADIEILRYRVPDFETLSLKQKELIYFLNQAALEGHDILYDQNNKHNLCIRRTLEAVYINYKGDRKSEEFAQFTTYLKRVWMGTGIHHHYSEDKFVPGFTAAFFKKAVKSIDAKKLPLSKGETVDALITKLTPVLFDPTVYPKRTNQAAGVDLIKTSANNYYGDNITQAEVEAFYDKMKNPNDKEPVSYGLNSKLVKEKGVLVEKTYKVGGLYGKAIARIVGWLEKAATVAENDKQKDVINSLTEFYKTGSLKTYDEYSIKWVKDLASQVDFVNGFTETYGDPLGMKASWESIVNFKNIEATKRTQIISSNAQWFEDHSPIDAKFKKETVKGVSAKVITATILAGDCYPATPIGVNLPNSNWIRHEYGSKSVTIENITEAYDQASLGNGFAEEFMLSDVERKRAKEFASLTNNLHTDLHECLGHGSGKLLPGVDPDALKAYGSTIEEARADLFGLYYMADPKIVELGLLPDKEAFKAEYYSYIMNGLMTQLTRIQPGKDIEEAHMRNRQLIASWAFEKGKAENVIEFVTRDGETFVKVNDYQKLRTLFGQLLAEIQRIKSTGDFEGGKNLVETYGVKVNHALHAEVLERYKKLNLAPYRGFVNPVYTLVKNTKGEITDVKISYNENYIDQHLRYSKEYSSLPTYN
ncbi:Dipeptidyl-peptidase III [Paludibacter propionicigenes WB4]|uniref:Dipeptidyl-peptidase III n=2 Tax=Paludibacter TaxID=346096 RepID=E4T2Q3_PALPW|nr:Dipeptidyl-peptidase III [Paludibacter propionicigenes WB4]